MLKILAVSGKKRSGKDEMYSTIQSHHGTMHEYFEPDHVFRLSFGDAVKQEVAQYILEPAFGITYADSLKEEMRPKLRSIWQVWGTDLRQGLSGEDYWHKKLGAQIQTLSLFSQKSRALLVITDLRFKHEMEYLKNFDTFFVRVERSGLASDPHPSEVDLDDVPAAAWDKIVLNNGSLVDYQNKVLDLYCKSLCVPKYV